MLLDNRTADRQTHPHAFGLGGIKRVEYVSEIVRAKPLAGIADHDEHAIRAVVGRCDQQLALAVGRLSHGLICVEHQIEKNLLQLNSISWNRP